MGDPTGPSLGLGSLNQGLGDVEDIVEHLYWAEVIPSSNPPASCTQPCSSDVPPAPEIGETLVQTCAVDEAVYQVEKVVVQPKCQSTHKKAKGAKK